MVRQLSACLSLRNAIVTGIGVNVIQSRDREGGTDTNNIFYIIVVVLIFIAGYLGLK